MRKIVILLALLSLACATDSKINSRKTNQKAEWKAYFASHTKTSGRRPASTFLPTSSQDPWGGPDESKRRPEADLANAASAELNAGFARAGVADVLVALPVKMFYSNERPYSDGQTNATLNFGSHWTEHTPPLIATLVKFTDGHHELRLRFHASLVPAGSHTAQVTDANGTTVKAKIAANGVAIFPESKIAWGDLFTNRVAMVQLDDQAGRFPLDFRDVVRSASELLQQVAPEKRALGKGDLLDPERVSVQATHSGYPFLAMGADDFGSDINADRYFPVPGDGIHSEFPTSEGKIHTAVGHGNTLVMIKSPAPFKLAYICFDARNPEAEAMNGVPSGGGWHEIGDPAETVFNTLEDGPAVFGYANGQPAEAPAGGFAMGLTDVAVIRKLMPGSALVTAAGATTKSEDDSGWQNRASRKTPAGRNYHWFIFDQPHTICALEWVHPCVPSPTNNIGMKCN